MSIGQKNQYKFIIKFLLIGGINTIIGYTITSLFLYMDLFKDIINLLIANIIIITINFFNYKKNLFKIKGNVNKYIYKFLILYFIIYIIQSIILININELPFYIQSAIISIVSALISYIGQTKYVFKTK
jgi:putative flippase GtrA